MIEEIDKKNPFGGFPVREQELKYNTTLFDLMTTLAARVTASLKLRNLKLSLKLYFNFIVKPREYKKNITDVKVG